jgi:hypothetical protein
VPGKKSPAAPHARTGPKQQQMQIYHKPTPSRNPLKGSRFSPGGAHHRPERELHALPLCEPQQ